MWYVVINFNIIRAGGCVVLCLGIGVCMLNYVVKFKCGILCSGREGYCVAQHILHNRHEYGPIDHTMTLLKPLKDNLAKTLGTVLHSNLPPRRSTHPRAIRWGEKNPSSAWHWPRLHTTWRNKSSLSRFTVHIEQRYRSPSTCPPQPFQYD